VPGIFAECPVLALKGENSLVRGSRCQIFRRSDSKHTNAGKYPFVDVDKIDDSSIFKLHVPPYVNENLAGVFIFI
jgi:hypothetical protein